MVSDATANDQLVGKINASSTPLRRPSQASTSMSPTGKSVPRIEPCGAVWFIPEQEQQKQTGSRRLRKSVLQAMRDFSLSSAHQQARHNPCPECGRVLQARIELISHPAPHPQAQPNMTSSSSSKRSYGHHRKLWTNNNSVCH